MKLIRYSTFVMKSEWPISMIRPAGAFGFRFLLLFFVTGLYCMILYQRNCRPIHDFMHWNHEIFEESTLYVLES